MATYTCKGCKPIDASIIDAYVALIGATENANNSAANAEVATTAANNAASSANNAATQATNAANSATAAAAAANAAGITQAEASVDSNTGTPSVDVSLVNKKLSLSFHNIKGEKGDKGDRGDGAVLVINDLVTGGTDAALSAEMGKTLNNTKQATLVSGTNIKTVNGESLLGEGNIIAGDPNAVKYVEQTLTDAQKAQARTNIDAYQKPSTGIPATDLASAAQTSLGKADTAYQKPSAGIPKLDLESGVQASLDLADSAIQARPMGEVDPTITPADYATKEELDELEAKVTNLVGYNTAPAWTANRNNYLVGEVCLYEGKRYICTTKHTAGATFDATKWEEKTVEGTLGNERAIYATFADLPATPGWVSSGKFTNTNYHRRHKAVPIPGGASVTVKAPSSGSMSIFVTKSYSIPASGDSVDFATGEDIRTITANNTLTFTAPNDARFIIFNYQYDNSTVTPAILVANGYDYLKNSRENIVDTLAKIADTNTSIASVKDDVFAVDGKVGGDSANTTYTSADYCGLYWASSQVKNATGNYNGILIPLIPGSKYTWNTGTAIQAFSAMPVAGSGEEYVRNVNSGFTADSTLKYLLLTVNITTFTGIVISNTAAGVYKDINTKAERLTMDDIRGLATQQGTYGTFSLTIQNIGSTKPFIISCDAKYSGGNTPPTIHFDIGNLYSSIYYTIGGNGDYERKQWRIPPMLFGLPLTIRVNVPSGCSLYIRDFDGREDGNITRYVGGLRLDAHLGFQGIAPENSIPAFVLAAECGYPASITNPIASADGTLYCYHEEDRTLKATGIDEIVSLTAAEFQSKTDAELADYRVVGLNTTNQSEYYDEKIPTLDDFFFLCAKTGMRPMFSTHPEPTAAQWATIKGMLTKYGLLKMFSVKAASVSILEGAFAVFGNDIDAYIYDVSGTDTATYVAALNGSTLAGATCRVGIEYEARDVTEAVATATLSAGYFVSVWAVSGLSGEGYYNLIRWGVTEFTDDYNPCSGLNF